jgi:hypothetical protein
VAIWGETTFSVSGDGIITETGEMSQHIKPKVRLQSICLVQYLGGDDAVMVVLVDV